MRLMSSLLAMTVLLATTATAAPPPPLAAASPATDAGTIEALASIHTGVGCPSETATMRNWCIPADGFATGTAEPIADGDHVYVGMTISVVPGRPVMDQIMATTRFSALVVHVANGVARAKIVDVTPSNKDEEQQLMEAVFNVAKVFKGMNETAAIDPGMIGYLRSLAASAPYAATRGDRAWTIAAPASAQVRKVGAFWVAVETPPNNLGRFVSMFTDRISP